MSEPRIHMVDVFAAGRGGGGSIAVSQPPARIEQIDEALRGAVRLADV
ncbi:MAG: hypothetical protein ACR2PO_15660 [Methyloligellaceae bacterium]